MFSVWRSVTENWISPLLSVTAGEGAVTTELAPPWLRAITLPGFPRPRESLTVTVIVSAVLPSAGSGLRLGTIPADAAGGTTKGMAPVCVSAIPSVMSVALKITDSNARSVTVNDATPLPSVTADAGAMLALEPPLAVNSTVFPATRFRFESSRVTSVSPLVTPSADTPRTWIESNGEILNPRETSEFAALGMPTAWPLSARIIFPTLGEPNPTCAKSDPIEAGSWKEFVPLSGYSSGFRNPTL